MKKSIVAITLGLTLTMSLLMSSVNAQSPYQNSITSAINQGVNAATGGTEAPAATSPSPQSNANTAGTYAALGDSVAAGFGLPAAANATSQDMQCGRSSQAYPYIVAQQRQLQLIDMACSGATAGDLFTNQGVSGPNLPPQLDGAFAGGTPQLITITAGANDVHWATFLRACYVTNCATGANNALASGYLSALQLKLHYLFNDIARRSNGQPPTVVVTGYYNPVSNYCIGRQSYATAAEINWLNTQRDALNRTIRNVASQYSFVKYASTNFNGHGLCAAEPWSQGLNDPGPLHPTAIGQAQIAQSILTILNQ